MSDNKASVEFHEKGKKHKENVAKRLKAITKKSVKDQKKAQKMDEAIEKMEQAALEAYKKDLENNVADLMSKTIKEKLEKDNLALSSSSGEYIKKKTPWYETKTVEGRIYYWNTETNQSIWDPPEEGYLTMEEQRILSEKQGREQLKAVEKQRQLEARLKLEEERQLEAEKRAAEQRERMKLLRPRDEQPEPPVYFAPIIPEGKNDPYGKWQPVEPQNKKEVDLQLPKQEFIAIHVPAPTEPVTREFKEKKVEKLGVDEDTESCTSFKKRKISGQKRNMRQRLDDD